MQLEDYAAAMTIRMLLILSMLALTACDQLSQRIWNCNVEPLKVTKVLDNGKRVSDVISARSYIGSMNGGVQVVSLEISEGADRREIWRREQSQSGLAASVDQICGEAEHGIVAEQL